MLPDSSDNLFGIKVTRLYQCSQIIFTLDTWDRHYSHTIRMWNQNNEFYLIRSTQNTSDNFTAGKVKFIYPLDGVSLVHTLFILTSNLLISSSIALKFIGPWITMFLDTLSSQSSSYYTAYESLSMWTSLSLTAPNRSSFVELMWILFKYKYWYQK